jgi:hypothetical protein
MTEALPFAAIAAAIYASECFVRVEPAAWCFRRTPRGVDARRGAELPAWAGKGLAARWPFPPFGAAMIVPDRDGLDIRAIRARADRLARGLRGLVLLQGALFVLLAGMLTAASAIDLPLLAWPLAGGAIVLLHAGIGVATVRARKRLAADIPRSAVAQVFVSPFASMRASDAFWRDAFKGDDPLGVAHVLCGPAEFERVARALWLGRPTDARARFLTKVGWPPGRLLAPPLPSEPDSTGYCPRCFAQFRIARGACPDCGHSEIVPL